MDDMRLSAAKGVEGAVWVVRSCPDGCAFLFSEDRLANDRFNGGTVALFLAWAGPAAGERAAGYSKMLAAAISPYCRHSQTASSCLIG
jgi:hypothetical protein